MSRLSEKEIRPKELFQEYLELSKIDGDKLDRELFDSVPCTACDSSELNIAFIKNGYQFNICEKCHSLFCSPRPSQEQLIELYTNSPSSTFWSNQFFPAVAEARREKLFKPKAEQILNLIKSKDLPINSICDVGAGHGYLLEEIKKIDDNYRLYAVEPDRTSASICREKGVEVLESVSEKAYEWAERFDLVISFEVIEHAHSPLGFVSSLSSLTKKGGYTLITGLGYEGFDILTLQEHSNSVSAPHHLNFHSLGGFQELFSRSGFRHVEVWTPGKLDLDIVLNSGIKSHFAEAIKRRGEKATQKFQEFLIEFNLSSHTWILAQK